MSNLKKFFMMLVSSGIASFFRLTNGVFGDGTNDTLQAQTSGGAEFSQAVSGNWTLEVVVKPPTTLTAFETFYSSLPSTATAINYVAAYWSNQTGSFGYYALTIAIYDSTGTVINLANPDLPVGFDPAGATKQNLFLTLRCTKSGSNYTYDAFLNGGKYALHTTTFLVTQSALKFNYLCDRNFAGRFSDAKLYATRFYDRSLTDLECYNAYGNGNYSNAVGSNLIFDFRFDQRTGNDFADYGGSSNKLVAVNFANIVNNLTTPVKDSGFRRIVGAGNSMMAGTGASNKYKIVTYRVFTKLANPALYEGFFNLGIVNQTTVDIINLFPTKDYYYYDSSKGMNIYVPFEVTNDLFFGASAATAYANYVTLCGLARARGFKIVAMTCLPRSNVGTPGSFEADRQTVNTSIRNNYASFADALADVGADTTIGDAGDELNLTYYQSDKVHMTDAGYDIVAEYVKVAILTL